MQNILLDWQVMDGEGEKNKNFFLNKLEMQWGCRINIQLNQIQKRREEKGRETPGREKDTEGLKFPDTMKKCGIAFKSQTAKEAVFNGTIKC